MEEKTRTKYYPISLKNKNLHDNFVIEQTIKGFRNADEMVQYLLKLEDENTFLEKRCTQKENDFNELLSKSTFSTDEIQALIDHTKDIDLSNTESDEYTENIRSANKKLRRMLQD